MGIKEFLLSFFGVEKKDIFEEANDFIKSKKYQKLSPNEKMIFLTNFFSLKEEKRIIRQQQREEMREKYIPKYDEVLRYYNSKRGIKEGYIKLIDFLYGQVIDLDFISLSSVASKYSFENLEVDNQYKMLGKINLESHTFGVFREAIRITRAEEDNFSSKIVILALSHDFGKSEKVRKIVGISDRQKIPHNYVSGLYIEKVCKDFNMPDEGKIFKEILSKHHKIKKEREYFKTDEDKELENNIFIKMLNIADHTQRERELLSYGNEVIEQQEQRKANKDKNKDKVIVIDSDMKVSKVAKEIDEIYGSFIDDFVEEYIERGE